MSETLYPAPRPLTVGEVLDLSFRIYRLTFVKCLLFGALAVVSNWLPNLYAMLRGRTVAQSLVRPPPDFGYGVLLTVGFLLAVVFPVAILYRQYRMATGQEPGGELARALRLLGRTILVSFLIGGACLLSLVFLVPAFAVTGPARYMLLAVLLLPAAYVIIRLACSLTAMVVEDSNATASVSRSWQLSQGNVLRLAAIYSVAFFLMLAIYAAVGSVTTLLYGILGRGDVALIAAAVGVVTVAAGALASPYYSALGLAVFGDLVVRKEGADLAQRIGAT